MESLPSTFTYQNSFLEKLGSIPKSNKPECFNERLGDYLANYFDLGLLRVGDGSGDPNFRPFPNIGVGYIPKTSL